MKDFSFKIGQGNRICNEQDIFKIISCSNYSKIYFNDNSTLVIAKVLKWFETAATPGTFIRINHSVLININYISMVNLKEKKVISNYKNEIFTISKRRVNFLRENPYLNAELLSKNMLHNEIEN